MDNRIWINIGLLGFILVLSLLLFNTGEEKHNDPIRISEIDQSSIQNIEVIRKDLDNFNFSKDGDHWYMQSPLRFKANNARINAMLRLFKN